MVDAVTSAQSGLVCTDTQCQHLYILIYSVPALVTSFRYSDCPAPEMRFQLRGKKRNFNPWEYRLSTSRTVCNYI